MKQYRLKHSLRPGRTTAAVLLALSGAALLRAEETMLPADEAALQMPTVTVFGEVPASAAANERTIGAEVVAARGGAGQTNPYRALDLLPSTHVGGVDAYGLSLEQNSLRIRGLYADTFSRFARTIDGVPGVVNVGQGSMGNTIDLENVEAMTLTSGAPTADQGFGFGDNAGSLDLAIRKPAAMPGLDVTETVGGDSFSRTFSRLDTGTLWGGATAFLSGSYSHADKWRGAGETYRTNYEGETVLPLARGLSLSVFAAYNSSFRNEYRPLTYAQASDLDTYGDLDYSTELTGTPAADKFYYKFNRQDFREAFFLAELSAAIGPGTLTVKPYYEDTDGVRYATASLTNTTPTVSKIDMSQEQAGVLADYAFKVAAVDAQVGYWYQTISTIPPPTSQKTYTVQSDGTLKFTGWGMLNDVGDRVSNSPYLALGTTAGRWSFHAGYRYIWFAQPEVQGYTTTGVGDIPAAQALKIATADATLHVDGVTLTAPLPEASVSCKAASWATLKASYGAAYASPWMGPLWSIYKSNQAKFTAAGISLQDLWDGVKLETSDHYELAAVLSHGAWEFTTVGYFVQYENKQASVYDPVVQLKYYQNAASAEGSGLEWTLRYHGADWFEAFASASYNTLHFTADIRTASGTVVETDGQQVPDAPRWLGKTGVVLRYRGFSLSPAMRYVDARYGDVLQTERIPSYVTFDLSLGYTGGPLGPVKKWSATLGVQNLLDRKYISIIKNDLDDTGTGSAAYYPGAPVTVTGSLSLAF